MECILLLLQNMLYLRRIKMFHNLHHRRSSVSGIISITIVEKCYMVQQTMVQQTFVVSGSRQYEYSVTKIAFPGATMKKSGKENAAEKNPAKKPKKPPKTTLKGKLYCPIEAFYYMTCSLLKFCHYQNSKHLVICSRAFIVSTLCNKACTTSD